MWRANQLRKAQGEMGVSDETDVDRAIQQIRQWVNGTGVYGQFVPGRKSEWDRAGYAIRRRSPCAMKEPSLGSRRGNTTFGQEV